ncbi:MAG TPA: hypothetical protein VM283_07395, partial [Armatimonadota bacterium]|nr:hypothetical protein [Armatimonadota bacterium]
MAARRIHARAMLLALVAAALSASCPAEEANLLANPGFEDGQRGRAAGNPIGGAATVEASGANVQAGAASLHAANTNEADLRRVGARPVGARQTVAVEAGRWYLLSVRAANSELKSSGGVRLTILDAA